MPGQRFLQYIKTLWQGLALRIGVGIIQVCFRTAILLLAGLGTLCTVLGTGLHTTLYTLSIQSAADDVVTDTGKVLDSSAADHNNRVLLQVMTDTGDISSHFVTVGQSDSRDLTECRVRLLGRRGRYLGANASLLRAALIGHLIVQRIKAVLKNRCLGLVLFVLTTLLYKLVKSWHFPLFSSFFINLMFIYRRVRADPCAVLPGIVHP